MVGFIGWATLRRRQVKNMWSVGSTVTVQIEPHATINMPEPQFVQSGLACGELLDSTAFFARHDGCASLGFGGILVVMHVIDVADAHCVPMKPHVVARNLFFSIVRG